MPGLDLARVLNGGYVYRVAGVPVAALTEAVPGWPAGWAGVPSTYEVARLNGLTQSAWLMTAGSLMAVMLCMVVIWLWNAQKVRR
jgi:hypothetical protein